MGLFKRKKKEPTEHEKWMAQWEIDGFKKKLAEAWHIVSFKKLEEVYNQIEKHYNYRVPKELEDYYKKMEQYISDAKKINASVAAEEQKKKKASDEAYDQEREEVKKYYETYGHVSQKHSRKGWFVISRDDPEKGRSD